MKRNYRKPKIFPSFAIFKNKDVGKRFYNLTKDGISFVYDESLLPHFNHIEMTGFQTSSIISYRVSKRKKLKLYMFCVYPQIRVIPNETRGGLTFNFNNVQVDLEKSSKHVESVFFNGVLTVTEQAGKVKIIHRFSPAADKKALIEKIEIINNSGKIQFISLKNKNPICRIDKRYLVEDKDQTLYTDVYLNDTLISDKHIKAELSIGERKDITVIYGVDRLSLAQSQEQITKREDFISQLSSSLKITTPDKEINRMLGFCKIRTSESIFETKNGLMHSPGGGNYYGALWTNDQCEYANPLFCLYGV